MVIRLSLAHVPTFLNLIHQRGPAKPASFNPAALRRITPILVGVEVSEQSERGKNTFRGVVVTEAKFLRQHRFRIFRIVEGGGGLRHNKSALWLVWLVWLGQLRI